MKTFFNPQLSFPVIAFVLLMISSIACANSTTEQLADAVDQPASSQPTAKDSPDLVSENVTPSKEAAESALVQLDSLRLISMGFGQDGQEVGYAFIVENPNKDLAVESTGYQVAAYDAGGTVITTDSGFIEVLLPIRQTGIGGSLFVDEGIIINNIEIQLNDGRALKSEVLPPFEIGSVSYAPSDYFSFVNGTIFNPYNRDMSQLRVSSVAYDTNDNIVGGGFTFLNFIVANDNTGVKVPIVSAQGTARVELYPAISGLSFLTSSDELPSDATPLEITKTGFGQDVGNIGFGMVIDNPNTSYSVENSQYRIIAYAEDNTVIAADEGYMEIISPNQTVGIGGQLFLNEGLRAARVDVQIKNGEFKQSDPLPFFTSENIAFFDEQYFKKVTGIISNPFAKDITNVRVSALAYNEVGEIIGGGFSFVDFIPANGNAAAEVMVTTSTTPTTVELYTSVSGLSNFE